MIAFRSAHAVARCLFRAIPISCVTFRFHGSSGEAMNSKRSYHLGRPNVSDGRRLHLVPLPDERWSAVIRQVVSAEQRIYFYNTQTVAVSLISVPQFWSGIVRCRPAYGLPRSQFAMQCVRDRAVPVRVVRFCRPIEAHAFWHRAYRQRFV